MGELRKKFCWTIAFTKKMSLYNLGKQENYQLVYQSFKSLNRVEIKGS